MNKKFLKLVASTVLIAASAIPSLAQATILTTDYNFSVSNNYQSQYFSNSVDITQQRSGVVGIDQFDDSLGTLTGVSVGFTSDFRHYAQARSTDTSYDTSTRSCGWSSCSYTYYYDDDVYVDATFNNSLSADILGVDESMTLITDRECSRVLNGSTSNNCYDSDTNTSTYSFDAMFDLTAVDLTNFVGNGSVDIDFSSILNTTAVCNSHGEVQCQVWNYLTNWHGDVSVAYEYTEPSSIPEPSSLILLSLALFGLSVRRFK